MRKQKLHVTAAVASLALTGSLVFGAGAAFASETPTPGGLLGELLSIIAPVEEPAPEAAATVNPFGVYDADTHLYTNSLFGISYEFGDGWEVEGHSAAELDGLLESLETKIAEVDITAINQETSEVILNQVLYNAEKETINKAYLENNKDSLNESMLASMGGMGTLESSKVFSTKIAGVEVPILYSIGSLSVNETSLKFYVQSVFIPAGDYIMMPTAISYDTDTTTDLLTAYKPFDPKANVIVSGMYDVQSMAFANEYFGTKAILDDSWTGMAPMSSEEAAMLNQSLAENGAAVELVSTRTATNETLISLILANETGAAINNDYLGAQAVSVMGALVKTAGMEPFAQFKTYSDGLLKAIGMYGDVFAYSPLVNATDIQVVDIAEQELTFGGAPVYGISGQFNAVIDGAEVPVFLTMAFLPDASQDYVNIIVALSFEENTTGDILALFE